MDADLQAIADRAESLPRSMYRTVSERAVIVTVELDADRLLWSDGHTTPILPVRYVA